MECIRLHSCNSTRRRSNQARGRHAQDSSPLDSWSFCVLFRSTVFTLLAERYERGSVLLTSNLPFSKWEGIFKDAMTTAAAIDRLVHHCVILELNIPSYRMEQAKKNRDAGLESAEAK
jgi:hypothetical protein